MTPDEKQIWVCDAFNERMHVYDATTMPPKWVAAVKLRDEPGWITFSPERKIGLSNQPANIIDVSQYDRWKSGGQKRGAAVQSEKMVEIQWRR